MIVVSNSSPLINLAWIGQFDLLFQLYDRLLIPEAVWYEIVEMGAGQPGAVEVQSASWIRRESIQNQPLERALRRDLDAGESQAIVLALETGADVLLMDERLGRETAKHFGIVCLGVIGLLIEAKQRNLIAAVKPHLDKLREVAGFWVAQDLYRQVLQDTGEA